jgi:hypothetical protein
VLLAGWVLLFNRTPELANPPLASWKKVRSYDTAWLCEEGRRDEARDLAKDAPKNGAAEAATTLGPLLRYRCERSERLERR